MNLFLRVFVSVFVVFVGLGLWVSPASAHTGFESSTPKDGAVIAEPVEVVTLVFSGDAEPTGDGFQILNPSGDLHSPSAASTTDNRTWTLRFDPPLSGGVVGVRWSVKAPDAHPIDGAFSFTTPESDSSAPDVETAGTGAGSAADATQSTSNAGSESVVGTLAMEDFLNTDADPSRWQLTGVAGRALAISGTLVAVGGMVFLLAAMTGSRAEVVELLWWIKRSGVVIIAGSILDFLGQTMIENASTASIWSPSALLAMAGSSYGLAIGLRLAAGFALAGTQLHTRRLVVPAVKLEERLPVLLGGDGSGSPHPPQ